MQRMLRSGSNGFGIGLAMDEVIKVNLKWLDWRSARSLAKLIMAYVCGGR